MRDLLTSGEYAARIHTTDAGLRSMRYRNPASLPPELRIGSKIFYRLSDIEEHESELVEGARLDLRSREPANVTRGKATRTGVTFHINPRPAKDEN